MNNQYTPTRMSAYKIVRHFQNAHFGQVASMRTTLGILVFWLMTALSVLAFVKPSESWAVSMVRGLGWWLVAVYLIPALLLAMELKDLKDEDDSQGDVFDKLR